MIDVKPTVLDLFCGCGGLSLGFIQAGYRIIAGIDTWQDALDTFAFNHVDAKAIQADLFHISPQEIKQQYDINHNFIRLWDSATDVKNELGYNNSSITNCCKNVSKSSYGYIWKYK